MKVSASSTTSGRLAAARPGPPGGTQPWTQTATRRRWLSAETRPTRTGTLIPKKGTIVGSSTHSRAQVTTTTQTDERPQRARQAQRERRPQPGAGDAVRLPRHRCREVHQHEQQQHGDRDHRPEQDDRQRRLPGSAGTTSWPRRGRSARPRRTLDAERTAPGRAPGPEGAEEGAVLVVLTGAAAAPPPRPPRPRARSPAGGRGGRRRARRAPGSPGGEPAEQRGLPRRPTRSPLPVARQRPLPPTGRSSADRSDLGTGDLSPRHPGSRPGRCRRGTPRPAPGPRRAAPRPPVPRRCGGRSTSDGSWSVQASGSSTVTNCAEVVGGVSRLSVCSVRSIASSGELAVGLACTRVGRLATVLSAGSRAETRRCARPALRLLDAVVPDGPRVVALQQPGPPARLLRGEVVHEDHRATGRHGQVPVDARDPELVGVHRARLAGRARPAAAERGGADPGGVPLRDVLVDVVAALVGVPLPVDQDPVVVPVPLLVGVPLVDREVVAVAEQHERAGVRVVVAGVEGRPARWSACISCEVLQALCPPPGAALNETIVASRSHEVRPTTRPRSGKKRVSGSDSRVAAAPPSGRTRAAPGRPRDARRA